MFERFLTVFKPQLFDTLKGYTFSALKKDFFAGLTVAIVALPLSMALAIASGTTPEKGLFTAVVAGFFISFLGGSRVQIGGPTGAFVGLVLYIISTFGFEALLLATFMAGILLIVMAFLRFGSVIKYIPFPVVLGFTLGIATILLTTQIGDFFGLTLGSVPLDFIGKWQTYIQAFPTLNRQALGVGLASLAVILGLRHYVPKSPAFLIAVVFATLLSKTMGLEIATIGSRFGMMPSFLPLPDFSFLMKLGDVTTLKMLFVPALTIAVLAGVESLLSAVVADNLIKTKHKSDCELMAQGVANIASSIFGGIPATGAIARTALNIKSGALSPFSGVFHAILVLGLMMVLSTQIEWIPLTVLGAILFVVAYNMAGFGELKKMLKAPRSDQFILVLTFLLTILVDLTVSISVGILVSAILFMKKMADYTFIRQYSERRGDVVVPDHVVVFDINGPFFFGATEHLQNKAEQLSTQIKTCIIKMNHVQLLDMSGVMAFEDFLRTCYDKKITVIFSNARPAVEETFRKIDLNNDFSGLFFAKDLKNAFEIHEKQVLTHKKLKEKK